ncbi:MAG: hypothetical protein LBM67_08255 [Lentimicrobiaceae bacterium]|jgi:hypothetical protein|nr:hypothetical protein [Lentimicrobiaceae bacterium]
MYWKLLLITAIILGIAFAAMAIRLFFIKGGEFKKQCHNAAINGEGCICKGKGGEACKRRQPLNGTK